MGILERDVVVIMRDDLLIALICRSFILEGKGLIDILVIS